MSLASVEALKPNTKKITLVELDLGTRQKVWFNYSAFTYYVDFDAVYDRIDPAFLAGVSAQSIVSVGSVSSDAARLASKSSIAAVESTELSFYWDASTRRVYIHLQGGGEPSLHRITLGVVYGVANHAGVYGGTYYEGRLKSAPAISKRRDPLFFGRLSFEGGQITIDNTDGFFDRIGEDNDVFGNSVRILQGFEGFDYTDFVRMGQGLIETIRVGRDTLEVGMVDGRKALSRRAPSRVFDVATYPNIKPGNIGKAIPLAYGVLLNVPVVCTNEAETGSPATYSFKLCDCTDHPIDAITAVRVNGVAKSTASTDLANGTFTLATADYDPGDEVTCDFTGYEDDAGDPIENAADVILDLLETQLDLEYDPATFDQGEWAIAEAQAADIGLLVDSPTEVYDSIEDICASARMMFFQHDDGRYTLRKYNPNRSVSQAFEADELLEVPTVEYDKSEVLSSIMVGYARDWAEDQLRYLNDTSHEAAVFEAFKSRPSDTFDTLLTSTADAQDYADDVMLLSSVQMRLFTAKFKLQPLEREIMDFVDIPVVRKSGGFLGLVKAEILGITKDLLAAQIELECRIVEIYPETVYVQGGYWGEDYWGDEVWGATYQEVVA
jgi:hypothetical protein